MNMNRFTSKIAKGAVALSLLAMAAPSVNAAEVTGWGDFKLFLDPGHSGRENQGLWGYSEAEKVLAVAHTIREYLTTYTDMPAENLKLCRETEADQVSLEERSDMANAWGADFFYSIHSDASATANTTVTLFGGWRKDGVEIEKTPNGGKAYGEILNPNLTSVMRIETRGNWHDRCFYDRAPQTHTNQYPYLSVNRRSNMASLLSEGGYHTIASQQQLNINKDYKRLEAFAAFQSILKFRGLNLPVQTFLTGIITNSENGVPVDGATVTVEGKTYTTDTWESIFNKYTKNPDLIHNGFFFFENLPAGKEVEIVFNAPGYDEVKKKVTIKSNLQGVSNDNVTWSDIQMTSNAPAKVATISVEDPTNVTPVYPLVLTFSRKMDKASVEKAFSVSNDGEIALTWVNDYTLSLDLSKLKALQSYTIKIDGSIAKNSQTNQPFDGNGDGVGGDNYELVITMAEPDVDAPKIVSTTPAMDGEVAYTLRPVIRIEFDEVLNWNEDKNGTALTLTDAAGKEYAGKLTHAVVNEASVLHYYLAEDLPLDKCFLVTLAEGLTDLSGNVTKETKFRFLSEYRGIVSQETLLELDDIAGFWAPDGSGSSEGLTQESNFLTSDALSATGTGGSIKLTYDFDNTSTGSLWQIREYHSGQNITKATNDGVLTFWVYGDGSNNSISAMLRVRTGNKNGGLKHNLKTIDYRGWNLVVWDLKNEEYGHFTGEDALAEDWRFDSFFMKHENTDADPNVPQQAWKGSINLDKFEFNKFDNAAVRTAKIDDIQIGSSAVEELGVEALSIVKSANVLTVSAPVEVEVIDVFNAAGVRVMSLAPAAQLTEVALNGLERGVYIVNVKAGSLVKTVKFVK